MTVNEMIKELQEFVEVGYGDKEIINEEQESIYSIVESFSKKKIVIYFD